MYKLYKYCTVKYSKTLQVKLANLQYSKYSMNKNAFKYIYSVCSITLYTR